MVVQGAVVAAGVEGGAENGTKSPVGHKKVDLISGEKKKKIQANKKHVL